LLPSGGAVNGITRNECKKLFYPAARFNVYLNHALLDLAAFIDPARHLVAVDLGGDRPSHQKPCGETKEANNQETSRDKKRVLNRDFSTDTGVLTSLRRLFAQNRVSE
jgi:hypothetical protein